MTRPQSNLPHRTVPNRESARFCTSRRPLKRHKRHRHTLADFEPYSNSDYAYRSRLSTPSLSRSKRKRHSTRMAPFTFLYTTYTTNPQRDHPGRLRHGALMHPAPTRHTQNKSHFVLSFGSAVGLKIHSLRFDISLSAFTWGAFLVLSSICV